MNDYPIKVKQNLNSILSDMSKHCWLFTNNPGHDFMRQDTEKLNFYDTVSMIIGMGKDKTDDLIFHCELSSV